MDFSSWMRASLRLAGRPSRAKRPLTLLQQWNSGTPGTRWWGTVPVFRCFRRVAPPTPAATTQLRNLWPPHAAEQLHGCMVAGGIGPTLKRFATGERTGGCDLAAAAFCQRAHRPVVSQPNYSFSLVPVDPSGARRIHCQRRQRSADMSTSHSLHIRQSQALIS